MGDSSTTNLHSATYGSSPQQNCTLDHNTPHTQSHPHTRTPKPAYSESGKTGTSTPASY